MIRLSRRGRGIGQKCGRGQLMGVNGRGESEVECGMALRGA